MKAKAKSVLDYKIGTRFRALCCGGLPWRDR